MERAEIRPTFTLFVETSAAQVLGCVEAHIDQSPDVVRGWVTTPYAELRMPDEKDRFWSPRLGIYAEDTAGGTHVHCRLGPKPDVWTLYVALYAAVGISASVAAFVGYSKWSLGEPSGMWFALTLAGIVGIGILYGSAFVGQRLSAADMGLLYDQLDAAFARFGVRNVPMDTVPGEDAHD